MATSHLAATLVQEVPADSGNFPWYMTDSIVVVEDNYSEVVVNVIDSVAQRRVSESCHRAGVSVAADLLAVWQSVGRCAYSTCLLAVMMYQLSCMMVM